MQFVLHLGPHKTASTFIQLTLARHRELLANKGVLIAPHSETNKLKPYGMEPAEAADAFWQTAFPETVKTIVQSDESLMGSAKQCAFLGDLYRNPQKGLQKHCQALPVQPTKIMIAVRDYQMFFPACYAELIATSSADRFHRPDVLAARVTGNMPSWHRGLLGIAKACPEAEIVVWRHEDFGALFDQILVHMIGEDAAKAVFKSKAAPDLSEIVNPTPQMPAIDAFWDVMTREGLQGAQRQWDTIVDAAPKGRPFAIWTPSQASHLAQIYQKDWAELVENERFSTLTV